MKPNFKTIANGNVKLELPDKLLIDIDVKLITKEYYNDDDKTKTAIIKDILYFKNSEDLKKYKNICYIFYESRGYKEILNVGSPKFTEQEIIDNSIEKGKKFIYEMSNKDEYKKSTRVNFTFYNKSNKVEIYTRIHEHFNVQSTYEMSKKYYL